MENMVDKFWNNKNVFVTGGTGFLGSYLVKKLVNSGANVTVLVRDYIPKSNMYIGEEYKSINVVSGKLEDYDIFERILGEYEIDTIFHLAASSTFHVPYILELNVPNGFLLATPTIA